MERLIEILFLSSSAFWGFAMAQGTCQLCVDGSIPDLTGFSEDLGWSCNDLLGYMSNLREGDPECTDLQLYGFRDCGCSAFPDDFCPLCYGGFSDIPDASLEVFTEKGIQTCGDLLFVKTGGNCESEIAAAEACGCSAPCSFCASGRRPQFGGRTIPYLSNSEGEVTCASIGEEAQSVGLAECRGFVTPPVAVDGQAFCGCEGTAPRNLCQLCPDGSQFNKDLTIPAAGGMTCAELNQYLPFVTDENSCNAIADLGRACCEVLDPCPVCSSSVQSYAKEKVYEPLSMNCQSLGLAEEFGHSLTCSDVQERFPYFCRCPNAVPQCTLCGNGEPPVDLTRYVPFLETTCGEINDYASVRLESECREMDDIDVDVKSFCGCTRYTPRNLCSLCPPGYSVSNSLLTSRNANNATCGQLADFAPFIVGADLCASVQRSANTCCEPIGVGDDDWVSETPRVIPTPAPTGPSSAPSCMSSYYAAVLVICLTFALSNFV